MWWGWPATLKVVGSPFHDSMLLVLLWGCGWVEHNDRLVVFLWLFGVVGFGALLGPERTPRVLLGVFFLAAPGLGCLTLSLWGWWWLVRVGVWLCVECCIVDASILL